MSAHEGEGGDPACWAHLFGEDDDAAADDAGRSPADDRAALTLPTPPAPLPAPTGGVTVLQLSDVHLTGTGRAIDGVDPDRRLRAVLDRWRQWQEAGWSADLVLLTGDNTDDGSPAAYRRLRDALEPLGIPILAVAGNHDDLTNQQQVFGSATAAEVGRWRVVGFTSAVPQQVHGTIDSAVAARQLDAVDERPTVTAIHHPPRSRSTHEWFRLDGGDALLDVLARRPHVRMLVSGHLHDAFELDGPGDLALLGAPSALVAIAHHGDRYEVGVDAPTGARILHLADDGSSTTTLLVA